MAAGQIQKAVPPLSLASFNKYLKGDSSLLYIYLFLKIFLGGVEELMLGTNIFIWCCEKTLAV